MFYWRLIKSRMKWNGSVYTAQLSHVKSESLFAGFLVLMHCIIICIVVKFPRRNVFMFRSKPVKIFQQKYLLQFQRYFLNQNYYKNVNFCSVARTQKINNYTIVTLSKIFKLKLKLFMYRKPVLKYRENIAVQFL